MVEGDDIHVEFFHDEVAVAEVAGKESENVAFFGGVGEEGDLFEFGFFGARLRVGEEVFKEVFDTEVRVSAVCEETVTALAGEAVDVARNGEEVFALSEGVGGGIERAGAFAGFNDDDGIGEAGDDAVAF